jgi:hypothetical protein
MSGPGSGPLRAIFPGLHTATRWWDSLPPGKSTIALEFAYDGNGVKPLGQID